jgi:hypothetical protein
MHKPQDCRLKAQMQAQPEPKPTETPAPNKGKRDKTQGLALQVMNAILEDEECENESVQQDGDEAEEHGLA